ncbi:hydrogenase expression/formation protein HypE [Heliobacterium gestii]|uniref:Hydrogenase expression/formation protein HypE n=1 Tax=Heliomicrobium gestii TaxID=2699 RepID=A0A845LG26_HELGE|nr:hydrogenase expression/formation protein HypE [Heliomicrobium gestii]MBM7865555.1 hydrogenase expression/formation protein HypE [Heliomicrobium gestii]MZP41806.1 hydrogenase expression/formation protein HypE [Heliomicrobium gestii]
MSDLDAIVLDHGTGSKRSRELVELISNTLGDVYIGQMEDSAVLPIGTSMIAMTTDSFVVTPIFFSGGNIGKIAICGTVNDLAVSGANPKYLTLSFVLEVGLPIADLVSILQTIRETSLEADILIVAGDTKVVNKGEVDKIFINTCGVGEFMNEPLTYKNIQPGDRIILSGNIGEHAIHLLSLREGLGFEERIKSDCAPLNRMIRNIIDYTPPGAIRCIRDVTRGGLSAVLHEFASMTNTGMNVWEQELPIPLEVMMAADMLGINPIHLANEGCICLFVREDQAEHVLSLLRKETYGKNACCIGYVSESDRNHVLFHQPDGSKRRIEELVGIELPRLC